MAFHDGRQPAAVKAFPNGIDVPVESTVYEIVLIADDLPKEADLDEEGLMDTCLGLFRVDHLHDLLDHGPPAGTFVRNFAEQAVETLPGCSAARLHDVDLSRRLADALVVTPVVLLSIAPDAPQELGSPFLLKVGVDDEVLVLRLPAAEFL